MIQCEKCKADNDAQATTCSKCQADLLPGTSRRDRLNVFGLLGFLAVVAGGLGYFSYRISQGVVCGGIAIVLGLLAVLMLAGGISEMFARTPPWHRYWLRAKRHKEIDAEQAIADVTRALELAPKKELGELRSFRAEMYARVGRFEEARRDGQALIDEATKALDKASSAEVSKRLTERAKLYEQFGMASEAAADHEARIASLSERLASAPPEMVEAILRDRSAAHVKLGNNSQASRDLLEALRSAEAFALHAEFKMSDGVKGLAGLAGFGGEAFEIGYASRARKDELKRVRAEREDVLKRIRAERGALVKAGKAVLVGYCRICKEVVDLDVEARCLRGHGQARNVVAVLAGDAEAAKLALRENSSRR